jgi:hypothetical protein
MRYCWSLALVGMLAALSLVSEAPAHAAGDALFPGDRLLYAGEFPHLLGAERRCGWSLSKSLTRLKGL